MYGIKKKQAISRFRGSNFPWYIHRCLYVDMCDQTHANSVFMVWADKYAVKMFFTLK